MDKAIAINILSNEILHLRNDVLAFISSNILSYADTVRYHGVSTAVQFILAGLMFFLIFFASLAFGCVGGLLMTLISFNDI